MLNLNITVIFFNIYFLVSDNLFLTKMFLCQLFPKTSLNAIFYTTYRYDDLFQYSFLFDQRYFFQFFRKTSRPVRRKRFKKMCFSMLKCGLFTHWKNFSLRKSKFKADYVLEGVGVWVWVWVWVCGGVGVGG